PLQSPPLLHPPPAPRDPHPSPTRRSSDLPAHPRHQEAPRHEKARSHLKERRKADKRPLDREIGRAPDQPGGGEAGENQRAQARLDRKSTRLNSSHLGISYAVFCLKKKTIG